MGVSRIIKKHLDACRKTSEKDWECRTKVGRHRQVILPVLHCWSRSNEPYWFPHQEVHGTSAEQTALTVLNEFERSLFDPTPKPLEEPKHTLAEVLDLYLITKRHKSADRQRRLRWQLGNMIEFLEVGDGHKDVTAVHKHDLERFMFSWDGSYYTLNTRRENLKGFWKYCFDSDFTSKNIASTLPLIGDKRQEKERRVPTLSLDEIQSILLALDKCGTLFNREGPNIAKQIKAFTLIERYTGMAVGGVAKLRKDELDGNKIIVNRKKTGEAVWTVVPPFVIDALHDMRPDSQDTFFGRATAIFIPVPASGEPGSRNSMCLLESGSETF